VRELVAQGERHHRVPLPDVILAATAASAGVGILHYNRHFDRLAEVLNFHASGLSPVERFSMRPPRHDGPRGHGSPQLSASFAEHSARFHPLDPRRHTIHTKPTHL
jgi:hypothetical protein